MSTGIGWTDETWNPTTGCDQVSPGCDNCYALTMAGRLKRMGVRAYQNDGGERSGPGFRLTEQWDRLDQPYRWRKPRRIFVNSMSDLFHEDIGGDFLDRVFLTILQADQHVFQVLTKRPRRMAHYLEKAPTRVAALLYNNTYGQRNVRPKSDRNGRIGNRPDRTDMAAESSRGESASGQLRLAAMPSASGRTSAQTRVFTGRVDEGRQTSISAGAQASLDTFQRANTGYFDDKPQKRNQGRQSDRKSGTSNNVGAAPSCVGSSKRKSESPARKQASQNQTQRVRRIGDTSASGGGADGQRHRRSVCDEAEGNFSDLQSADMEASLNWPPSNLWLGVSVENPDYLWRADILKEVPAAIRFVSFEPLIGAIGDYDLDGLQWIITGGESGSNPRPFNPDWARSIRDQCQAAGIPFFLKQGSAARPGQDRLLDGRTWEEYP